MITKPKIMGNGVILLFSMITMFVGNINSVVLLTLTVFFLIMLFSKEVLSFLFDYKILIFYIILYGSVPFLGDNLKSGINIANLIALKSIIIMIACFNFAVNVSVRELSNFFSLIGLTQAGFTFGIAFNSLPVIKKNFESALISLKLKGGFGKNKFLGVKYLIINLLMNLLKYADDVTSAAKVKHFNPTVKRKVKIKIIKLDYVLLVFLSFVFILVNIR